MIFKISLLTIALQWRPHEVLHQISVLDGFITSVYESKVKKLMFKTLAEDMVGWYFMVYQHLLVI